MESNKEKIIKKIIKEQIKTATDFLKVEEDALRKIMNKKRNYYNQEMISSLQHQIGYMTAVKYNLKETLDLINMTYEQITEEVKEWERIEKQNKEHMKQVFNSIEKDIKKTKNKKTIGTKK